MCPGTRKGEVAYVFSLDLSDAILIAERYFSAGEYPSTLAEAAPNIHVQGQFTPGNTKGKYVETGDPLGLYRLFHVFPL